MSEQQSNTDVDIKDLARDLLNELSIDSDEVGYLTDELIAEDPKAVELRRKYFAMYELDKDGTPINPFSEETEIDYDRVYGRYSKRAMSMILIEALRQLLDEATEVHMEDN